MSDKVADLLDDAADLLEKKGWVQGTLRDEENGGHCAVGAIGYTLDECWDEMPEFNEDLAKQALHATAIDVLNDSVPPASRPGWHGIVEWNDAEGRTQQEVLDLFRRAAKEQRA